MKASNHLEFKERPILYKKEMVLAKLSGQKTQTRRVINPQPSKFVNSVDFYDDIDRDLEDIYDIQQDSWCFWATHNVGDYGGPPAETDLDLVLKCPHGVVDDVLYGRETFWQVGYWEAREFDDDVQSFWRIRDDIPIVYDATGKPYVKGKNDWNKPYPLAYSHESRHIMPYEGNYWWRKKPSIHMPKKFSRIWDRIINIRVERVQEISEEDVYAEGIPRTVFDPIDEYKKLWDEINQVRGFGWAANPWVWVLETENIKIGLK